MVSCTVRDMISSSCEVESVLYVIHFPINSTDKIVSVDGLRCADSFAGVDDEGRGLPSAGEAGATG